MIRVAFLAAVALFCGLFPAYADESTPLLYSRTNLVIKRTNPPSPEPMPWQKPEDVIPVQDLILDVEVRDAATLYNQKGWYNLSSPSDKSGVLMVFAAPTVAPITPTAQYSPLDILMIDKEGIIKQIAPSLVLAQLAEEIYPNDAILAFLFMRGGACAKQGIQPGDSIEYKIFKKPPPVLSAPK